MIVLLLWQVMVFAAEVAYQVAMQLLHVRLGQGRGK
jgi:hypothetical protein